ncbi:hypothetical protein [Desulfolutivibrio sulfoxidireducens]|uniref:hypothetical protein n=1 Tax=Desulfolutivibrio sulfoxidireducens TaxID=2773299 RepID=UPI00159D192C|nr:hypothetical protein [Desulfolutivibrio sulfoxidireducens]QLA17392.1 hypothetical protein GD605_15510 [Desulfolutivibrio sulfoxidireducens]QLA20988.1 hypothetical protein GD604_15300 [Desulfolutivibrio sulfoxidireducens]
MFRRAPVLLFPGMLALAVLSLASVALAIDPKLLDAEPTVHARLVETPDPALLGCFTRVRPSEFKRPNTYSFCLVQKGDKYAVYYDWKDGKTLERHEGWMPFSIMKDRIISDTEASTYLLKDGEVWHNFGGREAMHRMRRN